MGKTALTNDTDLIKYDGKIDTVTPLRYTFFNCPIHKQCACNQVNECTGVGGGSVLLFREPSRPADPAQIHFIPS